ncbi:autotransporter outer membrane beta-barrel domain-containing protein, partial [Escherichia coli]|nr:autotransporter outer membrane beta-barrel domain-containing protein [Escherichia coli]
VSQLALACTLAITSQANATTYGTWTYVDNAATGLNWTNMDNPGTVDGNYVNYSGFVYYNNTNGDFDQSFNGDTVNGTISTYYLNHDYTDGTNGNANQLDIANSVIHGSITSMLPGGDLWHNGAYDQSYGYIQAGDTVIDTTWYDGDVFTLNIANSTIDDDYEALYFTDYYKDGDVTKSTNGTFDVSEGVAVNLNVESNINISNNSRVAGIALSQGNTYNNTYTTESHTWDNNINVSNSTVTTGSNTVLESSGYGHFGNSGEPSDYAGPGDVALSFTDSTSDYAMKNNVYFSNSTLMGDVAFTSTWNANFDPSGHDSNGDGVKDTNAGWVDDSLNVDELNITLDNGSKWVGQATFNAETISPDTMYDVATNSLTPGGTAEVNGWNRIIDNKVFQSGVFNVALNNGSEWDTTGDSLVDTLTVNNGSQVNVSDSSLTSDTIDLTNGSSLNIGEDGYVDTDHLTINSYSTVALTESTGWGADYNLYANTITVTNGGVLDVNVDQFDTEAFRTDKLELTSGNIADNNGNVVSGVFDIHSSDYVLNADLVNDRTWDTSKSNYGYGIVAMNSDGHLTINGNGDMNNGDELDNSSVD